MSNAIVESMIEDNHRALVNSIIRLAVAQAPGAEVEDRKVIKVRADQVKSGDIELTSRKHLDQNLVIDRMEEYRDVSVLIFYVGHDSPREVMANRIVTVAR